jgi:hypothetical protein
MTSNRTSNREGLGGFEEKLLGELKTVVAQRKAEQTGLAPARTPLWRRPRIVSVASASALAIGATIGVPLLGGESTAPSASAAFTLTTNDDGTITVTIHRWDDAEGLEEQLEAHGISAEVDYVPEGKQCQEDRGTPSDSHGGFLLDQMAGDDLHTFTFTLRPDDFGPDDTFVIEHTASGDWEGDTGGVASLGQRTQVIDGPVAPCVLEDLPPGPSDAIRGGVRHLDDGQPMNGLTPAELP